MSNTLSGCKTKLQLFFSHVRTFFKALFTDVESFIDTHVVPILNFLEGFKTVIDNPVMDTIAAFLSGIAGQVPEEILNGIRTAIDKVIIDLELVEAVEDAATFEDKLQVIATFISAQPKALQGNVLLRIASTLIRELAPTDAQKMDTVWRDTITQFVYNEQYHTKNPDKPVLTVSATPAEKVAAIVDPPSQEAAKAVPPVQAEVKVDTTQNGQVKIEQPSQEAKKEEAETPVVEVKLDPRDEKTPIPVEAQSDPTHPFWAADAPHLTEKTS